MRKLIFAPIIALLASVGFLAAPAQADSFTGSNTYCNNAGIHCTTIYFRVVHWDVGSTPEPDIRVEKIHVWVSDSTYLKSNNGLFINVARVRGPAGTVNWERNNVGVDKNGPGELDKFWDTSFIQPKGGSAYTSVELNWGDGSTDVFTSNLSPLT